MRNSLLNSSVIALAGIVSVLPVCADDAATAERLVRLERRLAELEARLADAEQESQKEAEIMAATGGGKTSRASMPDHAANATNAGTFNLFAGSAWRNLRWTQPEKWATIRRGMSEERVVEILGAPPRSVKSLKPRVDKVIYYETSLRDRGHSLRGKISFKNGKVIATTKPNFQNLRNAE